MKLQAEVGAGTPQCLAWTSEAVLPAPGEEQPPVSAGGRHTGWAGVGRVCFVPQRPPGSVGLHFPRAEPREAISVVPTGRLGELRAGVSGLLKGVGCKQRSEFTECIPKCHTLRPPHSSSHTGLLGPEGGI